MKNSETFARKAESKWGQLRSADWEPARTTTQTVAFRVIRVVEDADAGRSPIWGPCPLTQEEERVLRGLTAPEATKHRH